MRVLRSPITLFLIVGVLTVTAIIFGTGFLAGRAANDEANAEARATTGLIARTVAEPKIRAGLVTGRAGAIDRLDRRLKDLKGVIELRHYAIVAPGGRVLYADQLSLIGTKVDLERSQRRAISHGGTASRVVDAADVPGDDPTDSLLQTWTRIHPRETPPLLFVGYFSLNEIESRRQEIFSSFRWITIGPLLLLIAVVFVMLRVLTGQLTSAAKDRERLLRQAIDASDAERRRIARDLHDGVVQDLAGTAFSISAVSREPSTPRQSRATLQGAAVSLRTGLRSLRSLLAEIHPPDLRAEGLAAALADLIAPAGASGLQASVSVEGAETASDERAALVWRVAQEAVRNAMRHSEASTLAVTVRVDGRRLVLEVVDDGVGFDPARPRDPDRFGLRGLRSLVTEAGGVLEVRSSPGEGTTVHMEVDAR